MPLSLPRAERPRGASAVAFLVVVLLAGAACSGVRLQDLVTPRPLPADARCLVVGFLGGRDAWDDPDKGVRRLALELRDPSAGVYAETFENRRLEVAEAFVRQALDRDGDGCLEAGEVVAAPGSGSESSADVGSERGPQPGAAPTRQGIRGPRLVVFGQSFGGAATVEFARRLARLRSCGDDAAPGPDGRRQARVSVPVSMTVQIDSVGMGDAMVPANVRAAANLYQDDGWIVEGEHPVRAADPARTRILGNREFDYSEPPGSEIDIDDLPWWKTIFRVAHARMDRDPRVWRAVDDLVRTACAGELADAPLRELGGGGE